MITKIIITVIGFTIIYFFWKSRPIRNSHKLPQFVEIPECNTATTNYTPKGYKLKLHRQLTESGYHLVIELDTRGELLNSLQEICISWYEWKERFYTFKYKINDKCVSIRDEKLEIDIGSFNNCPGSKNFLKRTASSNLLIIDLLDYSPEFNDFSYEDEYKGKIYFMSCDARKEIKKFNKGLHFIDS